MIKDPYFRVEVLSKTERPNLLSYLAMHQCYAETNVYDEYLDLVQLSEQELGERVVKHCIKHGHYSIIEHPTITFNIIGFPHSVMVQMTRHRHLSFSVQSQRYTGERIVKNAFAIKKEFDGKHCRKKLVEDIFYLRPEGHYLDREGHKYLYSSEDRERDLNDIVRLMLDYTERLNNGVAPEHARDLLPQNIRQDFVVTMNARSLLHFCDLRLPKDAQPEIRTLAEMLFHNFSEWMPEIAEHYRKTRFGKNKLSP